VYCIDCIGLDFSSCYIYRLPRPPLFMSSYPTLKMARFIHEQRGIRNCFKTAFDLSHSIHYYCHFVFHLIFSDSPVLDLSFACFSFNRLDRSVERYPPPNLFILPFFHFLLTLDFLSCLDAFHLIWTRCLLPIYLPNVFQRSNEHRSPHRRNANRLCTFE
jgi:hypothetical protein